MIEFMLKWIYRTLNRKHIMKYNIDRLKDQLEFDEGVIYEIYLCPGDFPTFGVGHKITKKDHEWGKPVGTPVSHSRVWQTFERDIDVSVKDCEKLYGEGQFYSWPPEVQEILINMCFNLGYSGLAGFKKMKTALHFMDWKEAAKAS